MSAKSLNVKHSSTTAALPSGIRTHGCHPVLGCLAPSLLASPTGFLPAEQRENVVVSLAKQRAAQRSQGVVGRYPAKVEDRCRKAER